MTPCTARCITKKKVHRFGKPFSEIKGQEVVFGSQMSITFKGNTGEQAAQIIVEKKQTHRII